MNSHKDFLATSVIFSARKVLKSTLHALQTELNSSTTASVDLFEDTDDSAKLWVFVQFPVQCAHGAFSLEQNSTIGWTLSITDSMGEESLYPYHFSSLPGNIWFQVGKTLRTSPLVDASTQTDGDDQQTKQHWQTLVHALEDKIATLKESIADSHTAIGSIEKALEKATTKYVEKIRELDETKQLLKMEETIASNYKHQIKNTKSIVDKCVFAKSKPHQKWLATFYKDLLTRMKPTDSTLDAVMKRTRPTNQRLRDIVTEHKWASAYIPILEKDLVVHLLWAKILGIVINVEMKVSEKEKILNELTTGILKDIGSIYNENNEFSPEFTNNVNMHAAAMAEKLTTHMATHAEQKKHLNKKIV